MTQIRGPLALNKYLLIVYLTGRPENTATVHFTLVLGSNNCIGNGLDQNSPEHFPQVRVSVNCKGDGLEKRIRRPNLTLVDWVHSAAFTLWILAIDRMKCNEMWNRIIWCGGVSLIDTRKENDIKKTSPLLLRWWNTRLVVSDTGVGLGDSCARCAHWMFLGSWRFQGVGRMGVGGGGGLHWQGCRLKGVVNRRM